MIGSNSILPKISVIMSTFNESIDELKDSVDSILNQTYPNFEFIILDDNPKSLRLKKDLLRINNKSSKIKILFNKKNLGAAISRNKGVKYSTGQFIAIMDADDIAKKDRLYSQFNFLNHYNLDFVFPNYDRISEKGHIIERSTYNINSVINQSKIKYIFGNVRNISINSGWFIRTKVFNCLHGYRNIKVEDYDFIVRAISLGYKLGYQSKVLMLVRFRPNSTMRDNALCIYLITKYLKNTLKKNYNYENNISIPSVKDINGFVNRNSNRFQIYNFNLLIEECHNVKYNPNLINIMKLMRCIFVTRFSIRFISETLMSSFKIYIMSQNRK